MSDFQHVFEPGAPGAKTALVLLHGTGADEHDLLPVGRVVAPDSPLLSPLGKVRELGAARWFRRLEEGVFDEDDLKVHSTDLADFLRAQKKARDLPPLVALGFSNGANMAAAMMLLHPDVFAGAIMFRAMAPLRAPPSPDLHGKRAYLAAGAQDPMIPLPGAQRLAETLTRAGADVTFRIVEAGHGLTREELDDARGWLATA